MTDEVFKRRIRIKCDHDLPIGNCIYVTDVRTGEPIKNITEADIHLKANRPNKAKITCIKLNERGVPIAGKDGKAETETELVEATEVDLTVFESFDYVGIRDCLESALLSEGPNHKQWYLWKLAEVLGVSMDIDADKGIAP